ncbi:sorting nexin-6-like [Liolophura sinensis]|uniref:sorting nexin-6-like n=1 Tax=Liolophura sinensis TaxID=3198878 RepID=UPI003158059A
MGLEEQIMIFVALFFTQLRRDGVLDGPDLLAEDQGKTRSDTVDLETDTTLQVDISDALSERDKVKFTVHTKTTLSRFKESEFSVVRQHEEFVWLHDRYVENDEYAGIIIPPAPPRPDFDASREKLQKLGEGEGNMTREEFQKMKQELEAEYLATFKKTVAMHEVFLQRIAAHPLLRVDVNFEVFLEYDQDLSVRQKNKKEKLGGFFKNLTKSADEVLLSGQKDVDDFFEQEKTFLVEYHNRIKDATMKSDKMTKTHKNVADNYIRISSGFLQIATIENTELDKTFTRFSECLEKARKLEGRVASDEDLKLSDTLRYYMRDSAAGKDLLYRRSRALADYEAANKALDKARMKNKDVAAAERQQELACKKFERISEVAKKELSEFKVRRIAYFRKNLVDLAELELKHAKAQVQLFRNCITALKEES